MFDHDKPRYRSKQQPFDRLTSMSKQPFDSKQQAGIRHFKKTRPTLSDQTPIPFLHGTSTYCSESEEIREAQVFKIKQFGKCMEIVAVCETQTVPHSLS